MTTSTTHELIQAKIDALREAIANPTAPLPPAESLQQMFQSWADRFTVWHLRILSFLDDPKAWFTARGRQFPLQMMGSLSQILTSAYPELQNQRAFYDLVAKDLWNNGLMSTEGLHAMMSAGGADASRTTDIGKQFLRFITEPKPSK